MILLHAIASLLLVYYSNAQSCTKPTKPECDRSILNCCEQNFRNQTGLLNMCGGGHLYDSIVCYRDATYKIYFGQGAAGVLQVCDAWNNFLSCLDVSIRSCTTYGWYMKQGIPDDLYSNIYYQDLMFMCGPGLEYFLNNEQCMLNAYTNNTAALTTCINNFLNGINGQPPPDQMQKCVISDAFCACYAFPFRSCSDGGSWWGCEIARKSTNVLFPVCDTSCKAQSAATFTGKK